jgi:endo-1,4-beta-xylanase
VIAAVPFEGKTEAALGMDLRLEYGNDFHSWNDYDNTQEVSSLNYGTVNLRLLPPVCYAKRGTVDMQAPATREMNSAWRAAAPVPINLKTLGNTAEGSHFRVLWDDKFLYVLAEVIDPALDDKSVMAHEQDSVEVFVDQNNGKTTMFEQDDGQYRVNFRNAASFNGGSSADFKSRTAIIPGGYRAEMALPLYAIKPAAGIILGFDVQINDAASGSRSGIRNWANNTNMGYQSTAGYGILILTE